MSRKVDITLDLPAPVEEVWRCIAESEGIAKWFAPDATVEPGVGGWITQRWPSGFETREPIITWEPNKRLRTLWSEDPDNATEENSLVLEYLLEPHEGGTRLRLVHSGFGEGEQWDSWYDGISRGWAFELRSLRHYLAHHLGEPRHFIWINRRVNLDREEIWERISGPEGLGFAGVNEEGQAFSAGGVTGRMMHHRPPMDFFAEWDEMNNALLRVQADLPWQLGGPHSVMISVSAYNVSEERVKQVEADWSERLDQLFADVMADPA